MSRSDFINEAVFLSTPSARRATLQCLVTWSSHRYFYPRPPRGGRPSRMPRRTTPTIFLSTPSARRATCPAGQKLRLEVISIHALREEGDLLRVKSSKSSSYFYPRPPRGGRLCWILPFSISSQISIHALREEGDVITSVMG